jgi:Protein of unknown function (DUF3565)
MIQPISGFHLDHEGHWVAELACGHAQHVRHDPPWQLREWVVTPEGRTARLGSMLDCVRCDEIKRNVAKSLISKLKPEIARRFDEAGLSGLCEEGRLEAALGALDEASVERLIEEALSPTELLDK